MSDPQKQQIHAILRESRRALSRPSGSEQVEELKQLAEKVDANVDACWSA